MHDLAYAGAYFQKAGGTETVMMHKEVQQYKNDIIYSKTYINQISYCFFYLLINHYIQFTVYNDYCINKIKYIKYTLYEIYRI